MLNSELQCKKHLEMSSEHVLLKSMLNPNCLLYCTVLSAYICRRVVINRSETCLIFQTVKSQLYNILMFPEGGWLVDCANSEAEDGDVDMDGEVSRHQKQMDDLRQLCIPKVC